jgi:hypothetical protein
MHFHVELLSSSLKHKVPPVTFRQAEAGRGIFAV